MRFVLLARLITLVGVKVLRFVAVLHATTGSWQIDLEFVFALAAV